jgi:signal transduction histidine kinase
MSRVGFTVDTHIFRELGELLVGRDSTALVELIKNSYDADATEVTVFGECLNKPDVGRIIISDNGTGMAHEQFERGFLRIASRLKEEGERRSRMFQRRFTGAKGIGRIAAHKLARKMRVESFPRSEFQRGDAKPISAVIDWSLVESAETLDDVTGTDAVQLRTSNRSSASTTGTVIELVGLRRSWTPAERARFFWEVETFRPPKVLVDLPESLVRHGLLLKRPRVSDARGRDPGFNVVLSGDFEAGEEYWQDLVASANWLIEIDAPARKEVQFAVTPTILTLEKHPEAEQLKFSIEHPDPANGPFLQARILAREGRGTFGSKKRSWIGRASGTRVYMEGFRVLPYGEAGDDWLELDAAYVKRQRSLQFLDDAWLQGPHSDSADRDEGLTARRKEAYFGAVFLTQDQAPNLRMVVNREGFVPNAAFDNLKRIIRVGIDHSVRHSAAMRIGTRAEWRETRGVRLKQSQAVEASIRRSRELASEAEQKAAEGKLSEAARLVRKATKIFSRGRAAHDRDMSEQGIMQILAAVGLQMASFVHEVNGLLGSAIAIEDTANNLRNRRELSREARIELASLASAIGDMRRIVERQASYLTDVTSPDARRRRTRQSLAQRFDSGARIVWPAAERRSIRIDNEIPPDLLSPPMFPAETTLVFSNISSNAIKAAGEGGRIRAAAHREQDGTIRLRVENTGKRVKLAEAERWFRPFESTTTEIDPILGQGMGMGLPITRRILEERGADIRFVEPEPGFATALQITFQ